MLRVFYKFFFLELCIKENTKMSQGVHKIVEFDVWYKVVAIVYGTY